MKDSFDVCITNDFFNAIKMLSLKFSRELNEFSLNNIEEVNLDN